MVIRVAVTYGSYRNRRIIVKPHYLVHQKPFQISHVRFTKKINGFVTSIDTDAMKKN
jgi:hypothetical protein